MFIYKLNINSILVSAVVDDESSGGVVGGYKMRLLYKYVPHYGFTQNL